MDYDSLSRKYFEAAVEKKQTEQEKIIHSIGFLIETFQALKLELAQEALKSQNHELIEITKQLASLHPQYDKARVRELMFRLTLTSIPHESKLSALVTTLQDVINNVFETQALLVQIKKYEENFRVQYEYILRLTSGIQMYTTQYEQATTEKDRMMVSQKMGQYNEELQNAHEDQAQVVEMQDMFQEKAKIMLKNTKLLTERILKAVQKTNPKVEQEQSVMLPSQEIEEENFFDELETMGALLEEEISEEERQFMQDLIPDNEEIHALSSHKQQDIKEYRTSQLVDMVRTTMLDYFGEGASMQSVKKAFFDPKIRAHLMKHTYAALVQLDPTFLNSLNTLRKKLQIDALTTEEMKEKRALESLLKEQGYEALNSEDKAYLEDRLLTQEEAQYYRMLQKKVAQYGGAYLTPEEQKTLQQLERKKKFSQSKTVKRIKQKIHNNGVKSLTFSQKKLYDRFTQLRSEEETNLTLFNMQMLANAYELSLEQTNLLLTLKSDPAFIQKNTLTESIVKVISLLDRQYGDVDPEDLLTILLIKKEINVSCLKCHPTYDILVKLYRYINQDVEALMSFLEMVNGHELPYPPKIFWNIFMKQLEEHMQDNGGYYPDLFAYMKKFLAGERSDAREPMSYEELQAQNFYTDFE